jgi:O-antigen ligase
MATVAYSQPTITHTSASDNDKHGWGFVVLLATVATLFVRPADLIPALEAWPVYQYLIVACLIVSARVILRQLTTQRLVEQPAIAAILLLLLSVGASHLAHGFFWAARMSMFEVGKLFLFFLLINGLVNTPRRLRFFVQWLALAVATVATLALLDRFNIVSIAALESIRDHGPLNSEQSQWVDRIRGTGIFHDPNDFGLILVMGLILSVSMLMRPQAGWPRHCWWVPTLVLLVTLGLTHSRGAFLSLACAFPAALAYCRGIQLGIASIVLIPILAISFSARMTDMNAIQAGTGQSRIQIWSDSLSVFRAYPLFGIGEGLLVEELDVVAHNSFLQCYAELGILGGTAFVACFLAAGIGLWLIRDATENESDAVPSAEDREQSHFRIFIFSALVAYTAGMLTISRQFVTPTYLILAMATSAQNLHGPIHERWRLGNRFLMAVGIASAGCLLLIYLAVRIFVRW